MCGISCVVALNSHGKPVEEQDGLKRGILENQLEESLRLINHRGPDSQGIFVSKDRSVALGHVRLAINDLTPEGAQPFHDEEFAVHAVVNGELYDYEKIRETLSSQYGYKFKGSSDCEIVIALYKHYGLSFLSHLRGEFVLCLYDERRNLFLAARDRYGIKPLFWTISEGRLLVAAEIKAFLPLSWKAEWDTRSLKDGGWAIDERTVFKGVRKVLPGHYLTVRNLEDIGQWPYWDIEYAKKTVVETRSTEEMIDGVRSRLIEAVRVRLRADVPVGIYLSGGIDSSAIAGITSYLAKEHGVQMGSIKGTERLSCFSIAFDADSGFDESDIANRTAEHLGVSFHKKHMTEAELALNFEDATWHCEHHNPDLNYIGKYALSELPRENGFKVVLTGEGADENFAGYPVYFPDYFREQDLAIAPDDNTLCENERKKQSLQSEHATAEYYKSIGADPGDRFTTSEPRRMLNDISTVNSMAAFLPSNIFKSGSVSDTNNSDTAVSMEQTIANAIDGATRSKMISRWHPLHTALFTWTKGNLANIFLSCLGDRTEMAHSLEARTPFLDHHLTEYVNGLPPSMKVRWNKEDKKLTEKWILREAVRPFVTEEVYMRTKHPYTAPTLFPPNGSIHALLKRIITRDNVLKLGFLGWSIVEEQLEAAFTTLTRGQDMGTRARSMRHSIVVAQWIVLAHRFGISEMEY